MERAPLKKVIELPYVDNTIHVSKTYTQNHVGNGEYETWCYNKKYMRYVVPFNSDVLFRCAAKTLFLTNVNYDHIKSRVCKYLKSHRAEYEERVKLMYAYEQNTNATWKISKKLQELAPIYTEIAGEPQSPWDAYMFRLTETPNGGGIIEAEIISRIFNCKVFIFRDFKNSPLTFNGGDGIVPTTNEIKLFSLHGSNHFDLLLPRKELDVGSVCQSYIYESLYTGTYGIQNAVADSTTSQLARQTWDHHHHPYKSQKKLEFPKDIERSLDPSQLRNPFFGLLCNERRLNYGRDGIIRDEEPITSICTKIPFVTSYQIEQRSLPPLQLSFNEYYEMLGKGDGHLEMKSKSVNVAASENIPEVSSISSSESHFRTFDMISHSRLETIFEESESELQMINLELDDEVDTIKVEPDHEVDMNKVEPDHEVDTTRVEPDHEVDMIKVEPDHEVDTIKVEPDHEVDMIKVEPDHEVDMIKVEPDHEVDMIKVEPDHEVDTIKVEPDHEVDMINVEPDHEVDMIKVEPDLKIETIEVESDLKIETIEVEP